MAVAGPDWAPVVWALGCSWLLLLLHVSSAEKPAKLPLLGRKPFISAWNAPLDVCAGKYNISPDIEHLFHIQGSPRRSHTGQSVTIFYANRLGRYPYYTEQGAAVQGGLPQNCSLDLHLLQARRDILHFLPAEDFRGLAVIDWEYWRPQWSRNWHRKDVYRRRSRELVAEEYANATAEQVEELARKRFEKRARAFMQTTVQLGLSLRPQALWGFYLYPDCHNYNVLQDDYAGRCPLPERQRNDELQWLWNSSAALFPSVAIRKSQSNSMSNLHFSNHRIREALRVAGLTSRDYELPTYVYLRLGYRDDALAFLTNRDLIHTVGESAALGAAGFVIWGDLNLTSSKFNCSKVTSFVSTRLGRYIANVTHAAQVCSDFLCQSNGRCVRRDPLARHYLHLSPLSYALHPAAGGGFVAAGSPSSHDQALLAKRFRCHCYQGNAGARCDSLNLLDEGEEKEERKGEQEVTEEERRRLDWEAEQCEEESLAPPTGSHLGLTLWLLLVHLALVWIAL
ncbi:hyaluronidase-4 [Gadus chalcogrammus]|uniref:hyaluronidase-4 n=1 Tax=Gadus chalcogrammus TaxID=1042646 RepID=UPI0024C4D42E|nr:hyaluronidase-4 [Gadus chalcogrammus]